MKQDKPRNEGVKGSLPFPSPSELRGRQSVRATFRLSEKAIEALSIVSFHLGIKQKSLFDHLLEDLESLEAIARQIESRPLKRSDRVQKTYVISRRTLTCLERASRDYKAPRDALVEYSIRRLLPLIEKERERHRGRKEILKDLAEYVQWGGKLLEKAQERLGKDDLACKKLESAMSALESARETVESFVEKGKLIERF